MPLTLRVPTPADAPALAAAARDTFTETFGHLYAPEDLAAFLEQHTPEAWAAQIADPAYAIRIAEADGTAAGYLKLGPPSLPFTPEQGAIELRQFYLLKPHHGTGFAAEMMDWVLAEARTRGHQALYLSVFTDNNRARRFYARHGFEEVGPYAFKVGNHEDEDIVMRLAL
jgi:diamine N-acetyltransferase